MKALYALSSALLLGVSILSWAGDRQSISETLKVAPNEKIYIEAMRGEVKIVTSASGNFSVQGKLDEKAEGYELQSENGFTRFVVKMPRTLNDRGSRDKGSELKIEVPVNTELEFKGVNSKVVVAGVRGSSKITTVNGSIQAEKLANHVQLNTVNGSITSKLNNGRITLETVNGRIEDQDSEGRLSLTTVNGKVKAKSRAADVSLSVVNGEAELKLSGLQELQVSAVNGDLDIEVKDSKAPRIKGSTVSGDIELKLPANTSARYSLTASAGGRIKNELTNDQANKAKYGPGRSLHFTVGNGDGSVELTTVSGELKLDK